MVSINLKFELKESLVLKINSVSDGKKSKPIELNFGKPSKNLPTSKPVEVVLNSSNLMFIPV